MLFSRALTAPFPHHRGSGEPPEQPAGRAVQHHKPDNLRDRTAPNLRAANAPFRGYG